MEAHTAQQCTAIRHGNTNVYNIVVSVYIYNSKCEQYNNYNCIEQCKLLSR